MNAPGESRGRFSLTERQRDCFKVIERHIAEFKRPPTSREIAKMMKIKSPGGVHRMLVALQERGWINFLPRKGRSITVVPATPGYVLPSFVEAQLQAHCEETGENPADVVADAVALFCDEADGVIAA